MQPDKVDSKLDLKSGKQEISEIQLFEDIDNEEKASSYYNWDTYLPDSNIFKKASNNSQITKEEVILLKKLFAEHPYLDYKDVLHIHPDDFLFESESVRRFDVLIALEDWVLKKRVVKKDRVAAQENIKKLNELIHKEEERLDVQKKPYGLFAGAGLLVAAIILIIIFRHNLGQSIGINLGQNALGKGEVTKTEVKTTDAVRVTDKSDKKYGYTSDPNSRTTSPRDQTSDGSQEVSKSEPEDNKSSIEEVSSKAPVNEPKQYYIDRSGRKKERIVAKSSNYSSESGDNSAANVQRDQGEIASRTNSVTKGSIYRAIQKYASRGSSMSGTVTCTITVSPSGSVTSASVSGGNMPADLRSEISGILRSLSFSSAPGTSPFRFSWSFSLG